jgi:hypothetical protein
VSKPTAFDRWAMLLITAFLGWMSIEMFFFAAGLEDRNPLLSLLGLGA